MTAHGKTLWLIGFSSAIAERELDIHVSIERDLKGRLLSPPTTFVNPDKDRSLAGKKRVKARKAERR